MATTRKRDLLVPAALVKEVVAVLNGAISSARNDAERIEDTPESNWYTEDDLEDAKEFVADVTRVHDALERLSQNTAPTLLPDKDELTKAVLKARRAAYRGSNDAEMDALRNALELALERAGVTVRDLTDKEIEKAERSAW